MNDFILLCGVSGRLFRLYFGGLPVMLWQLDDVFSRLRFLAVLSICCRFWCCFVWLERFLDFHPDDFVWVDIHQYFHMFFSHRLRVGVFPFQGMERYFPHAPVANTVKAQRSR